MVTISEGTDTETPQTNSSASARGVAGLMQTAISTPVQTPSTPMQEPISVQPLKPRITNFAASFGATSTAEKRPSNSSPEKTASPVKRSKGPSVQDEPPEVEIEGGTVVLRIMEDDNSCMYFSLPPVF